MATRHPLGQIFRTTFLTSSVQNICQSACRSRILPKWWWMILINWSCTGRTEWKTAWKSCSLKHTRPKEAIWFIAGPHPHLTIWFLCQMKEVSKYNLIKWALINWYHEDIVLLKPPKCISWAASPTDSVLDSSPDHSMDEEESGMQAWNLKLYRLNNPGLQVTLNQTCRNTAVGQRVRGGLAQSRMNPLLLQALWNMGLKCWLNPLLPNVMLGRK